MTVISQGKHFTLGGIKELHGLSRSRFYIAMWVWWAAVSIKMNPWVYVIVPFGGSKRLPNISRNDCDAGGSHFDTRGNRCGGRKSPLVGRGSLSGGRREPPGSCWDRRVGRGSLSGRRKSLSGGRGSLPGGRGSPSGGGGRHKEEEKKNGRWLVVVGGGWF